jgi:hypothetical protein
MNIKQFITVTSIVAIGTFSAFSAQPVKMISTTKGKTYEDCRIFKVDPDGVMFSHRHGGAKILYSEMTSDSRNQFGYDPEKVAEYNKSIAAKNQKERELVAEYQIEIAKARAGAMAMNYMRSQWEQPQYAPAYSAWSDGSLVTPFYFGGFGPAYGSSYNAWDPINRHCGIRGQRGVTNFPPYANFTTQGGQRIFNTINVGRCNPGLRPPYAQYGTPALSSLSPALGVRPGGGAGIRPVGSVVSAGRH